MRIQLFNSVNNSECMKQHRYLSLKVEYVYETVSWTHIFILVLLFVLLKQENGAGHIKELIPLFVSIQMYMLIGSFVKF